MIEVQSLLGSCQGKQGCFADHGGDAKGASSSTVWYLTPKQPSDSVPGAKAPAGIKGLRLQCTSAIALRHLSLSEPFGVAS